MEIITVKSKNDLPKGVWLSVAESAKVLQVAEMTIRYHMKQGNITVAKVGEKGARLVNVNELKRRGVGNA